jgi:hypothetical protein
MLEVNIVMLAIFFNTIGKIHHAQYSLRISSDTHYWLVVRRFLLECQRTDPYINSVGSNCIIVRHYTESIDQLVFLIYTVHSISKAAVSTVAILF